MKNFKVKIITFIALTVAFLFYTAFLYLSDFQQSEPANKMAQNGKLIWQQKNCVSCHQIYGLGGHLGPDLTNVYNDKPEAYITAFLQSGNRVMPNFNLTKDEINDLIEFFKYINTTGTANPNSFIKNIDGTITQPKE